MALSRPERGGIVNAAFESVEHGSIRGFRWLKANPTPGWLGLAVAVAWPLVVAIVYSGAERAIGPVRLPFSSTHFVWGTVVNSLLFGLIVGGEASLKQGVAEDLRRLRRILPAGGQVPDSLANDIANLSRTIRRLVTIIALLGGVCVATLDPSLRDLYGHLSGFDPRYLLFVIQNVLFAVLGARLFATDVHMTRAYAHLGERVKVDLLDPSPILSFGRKGLRSVILWVSISTVFSMFWVLDSAGQANVSLAVAVLGLAIVALIAPTRGVHRSIAAAKARELAIVSQAIRLERGTALSPRRAKSPPDDARLGNLIQYQAFVKSIREWPFDLSIVSRSSLFILLGAGSWLGGAVVELLLNRLVD